MLGVSTTGNGAAAAAQLESYVGSKATTRTFAVRTHMEAVKYLGGGTTSARQGFLAGSDVLKPMTAPTIAALLGAVKTAARAKLPAVGDPRPAGRPGREGPVGRLVVGLAYPRSASSQWYSGLAAHPTSAQLRAAQTFITNGHRAVRPSTAGGYVNYLETGRSVSSVLRRELRQAADGQEEVRPDQLLPQRRTRSPDPTCPAASLSAMKLWRLIAGVLVFVFVSAGISPAWACACGGYLPDPGSEARVFGENALVRYDGTPGGDRVVDVRPGPVEEGGLDHAGAGRGDGRRSATRICSHRLQSLTRPKVVTKKTYWPFRDLGLGGKGGGDSGGAPMAPGGVEVRQQMELGPFEVARLGGSSATAVTDWLRTNGYVVPETLAGNLTPYIAEKWEIVAVKLAPKQDGTPMAGSTPPLRLTFASPRIVYPMRLSKGAKNAQTVTVYVAAPYRVDASKLPDPAVKPELLFAGRIEHEIQPATGRADVVPDGVLGDVRPAGTDHRRLRVHPGGQRRRVPAGHLGHREQEVEHALDHDRRTCCSAAVLLCSASCAALIFGPRRRRRDRRA